MFGQGAVTVENHVELKIDLNNRESIRTIRNHHSTHATLTISALKGTVGNNVRASDVDQRIISLQIHQN